MKINFSNILILLLGLAIGIGSGYFIFKGEPLIEKQEVIVEKIKKQVVTDTVRIDKIIEIVSINDTDSTEIDTLSINEELNNDTFANDTSYVDEDNSDEALEDSLEEIIIKEQLITQKTIHIATPKMDSTDIAELLSVKSKSFGESIEVEFWESPLNLTGYILTRSKLKLFGFNPNEQFSIRIGKQDNQLIYDSETISLQLSKTEQFKTLTLR